MATRSNVMVAAVIAACVFVLPLALPAYYMYLATELIIWGMFAMSLDVLIGYTGLPSFGHAVFFGVPAYVFGVVATRAGSLGIGIAAALGAIAVLSAAIGYLGTRTGGVGYIIVTLLASYAVFVGTLSWTSITGGENGLFVPEGVSLAGIPPTIRYLMVALIGIGLWACTRSLLGSNYGLLLRGMRTNERRVQAMGYDTVRLKFQATVVAGVIAGVAGLLYALVVRTLSADLVGPALSTEVVIWVLLGGVQTLIGPALGAAFFISLKQMLNTVTVYPMLLGLVFVAVVVWAPNGLIRLPLGRILALRRARS